MASKPGYKTTEFWLTLLAAVVTALYSSGAIVNPRLVGVIGLVATVLGALGYTVVRGGVKKSEGTSEASAPPT